MVNKIISPNISPWNWKDEKSPLHVDLGLTIASSENHPGTAPSIESKPAQIGPGALKNDLHPFKEQQCLEDGKEPNELR